MTPENRVGCAQASTFVVIGLAYPALYYVAFVITAVASLGGGGVSLELMVAFGACAAVTAVGVGAILLWLSKRFAPRASRLGPAIAWLAWALVAGLSIPVIEPFWRSSRQSYLLLVPPVLVLVTSVTGAILSALAVRAR